MLSKLGRRPGRELTICHTEGVSFKVGEWRVQPTLNRLARGDEEVRLEPKVMQVLEVLAETPGQVVARETLEARVWAGVFVSEDVLQRAIRELRRAFRDEAASPRYIETIRKRGYRLIAPVTVDRPNQTPVQITSSPPAPPAVPRRPLMAAASLTLVAALGAVVLALASRDSAMPTAAADVRFVTLTSGPLNESDPALSPDGQRLAFAMRQDAADPLSPADIYLTTAAGAAPEPIVTHPADDRYPSWSPDASTLAFVRMDDEACHVMLIALADRRERRLAACGNVEEPRVSWSANGEWLVESLAAGSDPMRGWQVARLSVATGAREILTLPSPGTLGDHSPMVSPDGTRIAFVRGLNGATADLHVIPFDGGPPARVTWDNQDIVGVDWSADGRSLIYATDRAGGYTIWRVPVAGGASQLVAGGAAKLKHPTVARATGRLAYESWAYEINLWESPVTGRVDLEDDPAAALRPIVRTSEVWNHSPDLSPDGTRLAFVSTRSGGAELWVADRDGARPRQLTTFGRASIRQPRWSPDSTRILISAGVNGQLDLYAIDAASAALTKLTDDADDEVAPAWTHDGAAVLFGARRGGTWQIVRMDVADGTRTPLTTGGGYAAQPSPDGRSILFTRLESPGVWTMPASGGEARLLVPGVRAADTMNWRVAPSGIYYLGVTGNQPVVRRAPLAGGDAVDVAWIANYSWPGFAVSADGARVIYAHWDRRDSNIMAME